MTDTEIDKSITADGDDAIHIERDLTFSRHVADHALVLYMGRDLELSFLQVGPKVVTKHRLPGSETASRFEMTDSTAEVARIRMSPAVAAQMAMTIIDDLVEEGDINPVAFRSAIEKILEKAPSGPNQDQSEA